MNKPKSTTIQLTSDVLNDMDAVSWGHVERVAKPGEYKVWRKGGKVFLEAFHND